MRLMMLRLVILLSDEELFWKEQRISWGNFQMLLWTYWYIKHTLMKCVYIQYTLRNLCAHKSEHSHKHTHGDLLMHWWTRLQLGQAVKIPEGLFSRLTSTLFLLPSLFSLCFYSVTDVLASVLLSWPLAGYFSSSDTLRRKNKHHMYSAGS